jgi:hypothetical protein
LFAEKLYSVPERLSCKLYACDAQSAVNSPAHNQVALAPNMHRLRSLMTATCTLSQGSRSSFMGVESRSNSSWPAS